MELLLIFIVLNVVNVVLQTVRSIVTIKCNKWIAAVVNAIAYGLYTIVIVYTVCDLPLWVKAVVVAVANLLGVFGVKIFEEKSQKDKLWKVEANLTSENFESAQHKMEIEKIPHNYQKSSDGRYILNCFCQTQEDSKKVKSILEMANAKFFVSESKKL